MGLRWLSVCRREVPPSQVSAGLMGWWWEWYSWTVLYKRRYYLYFIPNFGYEIHSWLMAPIPLFVLWREGGAIQLTHLCAGTVSAYYWESTDKELLWAPCFYSWLFSWRSYKGCLSWLDNWLNDGEVSWFGGPCLILFVCQRWTCCIPLPHFIQVYIFCLQCFAWSRFCIPDLPVIVCLNSFSSLSLNLHRWPLAKICTHFQLNLTYFFGFFCKIHPLPASFLWPYATLNLSALRPSCNAINLCTEL